MALGHELASTQKRENLRGESLMDRRPFLIGSDAVLTTAFVAKANWYIRNKNAVVTPE